MSKPNVEETLGKWRLVRWQYDGAPLEAESEGGIEINVDTEYLSIEWGEQSDDCRGHTTRSVCVPTEVLHRLMADLEKRAGKAAG